jgi:hypothetical protein
LAQLAVGLTHRARGNVTGAVTLLDRGARNIEPYTEAPPHGVDVAGLLRWTRALDPAGTGPAIPRLRAGGTMDRS